MLTHLDDLIRARNKANEALDAELNRRRDGCEHTHVYRAHAGVGGYLWMCEHCFSEAHGWALYGRMKADWIKEISWGDFMALRPDAPSIPHFLEINV